MPIYEGMQLQSTPSHFRRMTTTKQHNETTNQMLLKLTDCTNTQKRWLAFLCFVGCCGICILLYFMLTYGAHPDSDPYQRDSNGNTNPITCVHSRQNTTRTQHSKPRVIWIDGGANIGDTFLSLVNTHAFLPSIISISNVEAFLFEVNPRFNDALTKLRDRYYVHSSTKQVKRFEFFQKAVWDKNHVVTINLDTVTKQHNYWGTSMYENGDTRRSKALGAHATAHAQAVQQTTVEVPSVDICDFLQSEIGAQPRDFVHLKLDIEGSEFAVLNRILADDECFVLIDEITCEFHQHFTFSEAEKKSHLTAEQYDKQLRAKGIRLFAWHRRRGR